jgi:hypothetical protein
MDFPYLGIECAAPLSFRMRRLVLIRGIFGQRGDSDPVPRARRMGRRAWYSSVSGRVPDGSSAHQAIQRGC